MSPKEVEYLGIPELLCRGLQLGNVCRFSVAFDSWKARFFIIIIILLKVKAIIIGKEWRGAALKGVEFPSSGLIWLSLDPSLGWELDT